jgi:hypothetical protein
MRVISENFWMSMLFEVVSLPMGFDTRSTQAVAHLSVPFGEHRVRFLPQQ